MLAKKIGTNEDRAVWSPRAIESNGSASAEVWPLSLSQEARLAWEEFVADAGLPRLPPLHFPVAFLLRGSIDLGVVERVLKTVVRRHHGLAASYRASAALNADARRRLLRHRRGLFVPGLFVQQIEHEADVAVQHRVLDIGDARSFDAIVQEEAASPLDLGSAPQLRATVASRSPDEHVLVLTSSHLTVDGWSTEIIVQEVMALYSAAMSDTPCVLPNVAGHAGEFAAFEQRRLHSGMFDAAIDFWHRQWREAESALVRHAELPFSVTQKQALPRHIGSARHRFDTDVMTRIRQFCRMQRFTPYVVFRAGFARLLSRYTGRPRVAFWANFANRRHQNAERMVCSCANAHILTVDGTGHDAIELCRRTATQLFEAHEYESVPFAALRLRADGDAPQFDSRITFDTVRLWWRPQECRVIDRLTVPGGHRWVDLDVRFTEEHDAYVLRADYDSRRYSDAGVVRFLADFAEEVSRLITAGRADNETSS